MHRRRPLRFSLCVSTVLFCTGFCSGADLKSAKRAYEQKDYATAFKELTPLAKQGNADAEVLLGRMYLMGYGVLKDPDEAYKLFDSSAQQGNADAQYFLGARAVMRHVDIAEGLKSLRRSAEQGNQDAQLLLGKTYLQGLGSDLQGDPVQADMWLRLAADHNLPFYQSELRVAERQMNAAQISKGEALAEAWKREVAKAPAGKAGARQEKRD